MKKFAILALAALMVVALTVPASALENEFGGAFNTRFQSRNNFDGFDRSATYPGADDHDQNVMQRTRLYYTAKINDNLKLVNKFEMDATWGSAAGSRAGGAATNRGYGQVGADGANIEIKNTYVDFNTGPVNWTIGTQGYNLFRGYYIADDASGVIARWKVLDNFVLAGSWLKVYEGGQGQDNADVDSYTLTGAFWFSENISIKPSINWAHTSDLGPGAATGAATGSAALSAAGAAGLLEDADTFNYGFDFDMAYDNWGLWVTAILQDGSVSTVAGDLDNKGYLVGVGGNVMLGMFDLYAEAAFSSGDDDPLDSDNDTFTAPYGSHVWSELLADGTLWNGGVAGRPDNGDTYDQMGNVWYVGVGCKVSPMDKLTINPSVWYVGLDEDNQTGDDSIGTEANLVVSYQLIEGLNVDLIGAYLWADDAFSDIAADNEDDAYEYGMQISLSF